MSNFTESRRDLDSYIAARVPLIGIRTIEQVRAIRLVKEVAANPRRANLPFWIYTRATGIRDLRTNSPVSEDRSLTGAMEFAATQFGSRSQATFIFVDPDDLSDDTPASRHVAEIARLADANSGSIVLITDTPLWSGLQRLGMSVHLDLPDANEMYDVIVAFLADHNGIVPIDWSEQDARRAAEFMVGVPEGTAINVLATTVAKGSVVKDDVERVAQFKDKHFGDLAGLERVQLKAHDLQVGGLSSPRNWLRRKHQLMVADLRNSELRPPRGVLLVGVPGCGKSLSAKAISAEWMYYQRYVHREPSTDLVDKLVAMSEGFAGSDLESALHDVGAEVLLNGGPDSLRPDFVVETFANTFPLSRTNPEQIEEIRMWGRERAVPAGRVAETMPGGQFQPGRRVVVTGG